jgi:diguanylate cyclase (GGDEF)-like protein
VSAAEIAGHDAGSSRATLVRAYELAVAIPLMLWITFQIFRNPEPFADPVLLLWAVAIAGVDLLPVPNGVGMQFSLSFPLLLSVAFIYPAPVAALVAFVGTADPRQFRGELPICKGLFNRGEVTASVIAESLLFHALVALSSPWYAVVGAALLATVLGYCLNVLLVALYFHVVSSEGFFRIVRQMHFGVFGEFVLSYIGLALFSVLAATTFLEIGPWSIAVFVAPLAFARQMFHRSHSLQVATEELAAREREKEHQALHDPLTGLPNRMLFLQQVQEALDDARERGGHLATMLIDLDQFKEINDTLGHQVGDMVLQAVGPRLEAALRDGDTLARLGGDEFAVLLPGLPDDDVAVRIAARLLEELELPFAVDDLALGVAASVGIALRSTEEDAATLLRHADIAMYAAKESGGGYEVYEPALDRNGRERLTLTARLREALANGEFVLHYQPKVRTLDGSVVGVEALVRWQHPDRGLLPPADFIGLLERSSFLGSFTIFVLDEALHQWHRWAREGVRVEMAVNVSSRSLLDTNLPDRVAGLLRHWGVPPSCLTLELTESFLMSDSGRCSMVLKRLSQVGVGLSIDDFGTGYSSLSHLKRLPISEIKVDRSFVSHMRRDPSDSMIVRATIDLARNLGIRVVAEGVEDEETWEELVQAGCDLAQGFFMSRALAMVRELEVG